ncbi:MAG: radical SAM family heme chaperone HemW [Hellea sp.]|nr:radical SAM family heme chaperone HemW [Hellea sp.]
MAKSPLAIYIHWPYCARICPYCDFNVYKGTRNDALVSAIDQDLTYWRERTGTREIISIHFGGGTPSLLPAAHIGRLVDKVDKLWGLAAGTEVGLEANPADTRRDYWKAIRSSGVNRISLGVQSFNDGALKFLGRDHDGAQAIAAAGDIASIFSNFSLDLIFGWAGQSANDWSQDLKIALSLKPAHLSTYQLTIEPGTAFERAEARGNEKAVHADQSADLYDQLRRRLTSSGFEHYEISNFAQRGHRSRHNLAYWQGHDYIGVGPGAHGRVTSGGQRIATTAKARPGNYISSVQDQEPDPRDQELLSGEDWAAEYLMMGMRIQDGISIARFEELVGHSIPAAPLNDLIAADLIQKTKDKMTATETGRPLLDHIIRKLLT